MTRKQARLSKNRTLWGILGVMLVFGTMTAGCDNPNNNPPGNQGATYTVTFDTDGGTEVSSQSVVSGGKVTRPADPTKAEHTFANWYKEEDKTNLWSFDTDAVTEDTTLYAKWVAGENVPSFTVTFNTDGGTPVPSPQSVVQGEPVAKPADPVKTGKIFDGWYKEGTTNPWNFNTDTVTAATTLYAKWVEAVTVTFNTDGGSAIPPVTVATGSTVNLSSYQTTKANHIFEGWYTDLSLTEAADSSLTVNTNIILYAKWVEAVTVTFDTNGGSAIPSVTVAKGGTVNLSSYQTTKAGHIFEGWYTDLSLTEAAGSSLTVTADITLYAKWTSTSVLAPYAGVWRSDSDAYWLKNDGTAWRFSSHSFGMCAWSLNQIDGDAVTFAVENTTFVFNENNSVTYTKNTTSTKTPGAADSGLQKTWLTGSSRSMELKSDAAAVLINHGDTITLNYCVESSTLYLLSRPGDLEIVSLTITDGKPAGFSLAASDSNLAGIWKRTVNDQDYYWTLNADGAGTFSTLGASLPVSFGVTDAHEIDGNPYTISNETLTLAGADHSGEEPADIALTKVESVPAGSGAGWVSSLYGAWNGTQGGVSFTLTFSTNGTMNMTMGSEGYSAIWQANGSVMYLYRSDFDLDQESMPYTLSGSTLTIMGMPLTKQP